MLVKVIFVYINDILYVLSLIHATERKGVGGMARKTMASGERSLATTVSAYERVWKEMGLK
jgi:hypothetical protein